MAFTRRQWGTECSQNANEVHIKLTTGEQLVRPQSTSPDSIRTSGYASMAGPLQRLMAAYALLYSIYVYQIQRHSLQSNGMPHALTVCSAVQKMQRASALAPDLRHMIWNNFKESCVSERGCIVCCRCPTMHVSSGHPRQPISSAINTASCILIA